LMSDRIETGLMHTSPYDGLPGDLETVQPIY
jgi:hypothetical protein